MPDALAKVPAGHFRQIVAPTCDTDPSSHGEHFELPLRWNVLIGHGSHEMLPAFDQLPGSQSLHVPDALANVPA
jgi:hypothetical protein